MYSLFLSRRSIDVLDPKKTSLDPDSFGPDPDPGLTEDVWYQKYENKKEFLQNYLENSFNSILNIFYRSGYRDLDPKFGQNRIRNTGFSRIFMSDPDPQHWWQEQLTKIGSPKNCLEHVIIENITIVIPMYLEKGYLWTVQVDLAEFNIGSYFIMISNWTWY